MKAETQTVEAGSDRKETVFPTIRNVFAFDRFIPEPELSRGDNGRLVRRLLARPHPDNWRQTRCDRKLYLDLMEQMVRVTSRWQAKEGAIIDPVTAREEGQTTPRFASSGAILLHFGRIPELSEQILMAMDWSCERLATGKAASPDFWMRELSTALACFRILGVSPLRLATWERHLRQVIPEIHYQKIAADDSKLATLNNWAVYASAGEMLRATMGFGCDGGLSGTAFFERYIPAQLAHFTEAGMYRDPGDPITYDLATRLQLSIAILAGEESRTTRQAQSLLQRGALTQLLYLSPTGLVPYGGRSSEFLFLEAIVSAICELEARRYANTEPALAGAFKRQARLSARTIQDWANDDGPLHHIRNRFPPELRWGDDVYAHQSCYGLTTASFLGLAALFADDTIEESPCPAEIGGYTLALAPSFHKIFANGGGYYLEIDTKADFRYDTTGLGRIHRAGEDPFIALNTPSSATPTYLLPKEHLPERHTAFGPEWLIQGQWHRLAECSDHLSCEFFEIESSPDRVRFLLVYAHGSSVIRESYDLMPAGCRFSITALDENQPIDKLRLIIPSLITNGENETRIDIAPGKITCHAARGNMNIRHTKAVAAHLDAVVYGNRNGLCRNLILETAEPSLDCFISIHGNLSSEFDAMDDLFTSRHIPSHSTSRS